MLKIAYLTVVYFLETAALTNADSVQACDSSIFCQGDILETVQMARIFNDSKYFVDMPMRFPENTIQSNYDKMIQDTKGSPTNMEIESFVDENFLPPGEEFEAWIPSDWIESPSFTGNIQNEEYRNWAIKLNALWLELGRKIKTDVKNNPEMYTILYSKNPLVIPGGRFRELYYWDSFWVIKGLLLCEMQDTVKGMISNFIDFVENDGLVPNSGRIYAIRRSQPPLLTAMVLEYWKSTGDFDFVQEILPTLEKEHSFWMSERTAEVVVDGETLILNRYASETTEPRPESYYEDETLITPLSEADGQKLMTHVTSGAESGWGFSLRWTGSSDIGNDQLLSEMITTEIIPVDLNSFLALTERTLAELHTEIGNTDKVNLYTSYYQNRTIAMEKLLWSDQDGCYYDYNMKENSRNVIFYISNVVPLWVKCYGDGVDILERETSMYNYLKNGVGVLDFPGGIPISLKQTGQQWDFPNAWPPLMHMIVEGMKTSKVEELNLEADKQATKWLASNYVAYNKTEYMYEKYDVRTAGGNPGEGGEYKVQLGFGWSNAVVLDFLNTYGKTASPFNPTTELPPPTTCVANKLTISVPFKLATLIFVLSFTE